MMGPGIRGLLAGAAVLACAALVLPQAGSAQTFPDLDQIVQSGAKPKDGLQLARSQAGANAWLEALATLERVLAVEPGNKQSLLLHASILCRIDDPDGAALEFSRLRQRDYKKAEWAEARAPCLARTEPGR